MENRNTDKEALVSLYKNAHIALQSISDIIKEVSDENMKRELSDHTTDTKSTSASFLRT